MPRPGLLTATAWVTVMARNNTGIYTAYRRNGFDDRKVAMAVVVQRMVFPQAAGILFTAGVALFLWDFFFLAPSQRRPAGMVSPQPIPTR